MADLTRRVTADFELDVTESATLVWQVAVSRLGDPEVRDSFDAHLDGHRLEPEFHLDDHGNVLHLVRASAGRLTVAYTAEVSGRAAAVLPHPLDATQYLRPSRYAESDRMFALANREFGSLGRGLVTVTAVTAWVHDRLNYISGSSRPTDGAIDTLLAGEGVCRDYAHLVVALLRALDIPARLVAVYAPGLSPMDFHAVVEALVDEAWWVVDATGLAPRQSLLRICTGRDGADTAFLSTYDGEVVLNAQQVTATAWPALPLDDGVEPVQLS